MNIFMSWYLDTYVTIPAGFALTSLQQVVSFILFMIYFGAAHFTPYRYTPTELKTNFEIVSVIIFGCVFAANVALNNFSLGYISFGVKLIIRSCLPLSTYISQQGLAMLGLYLFKPFKILEVWRMFIGGICAC